MKKYLAFIALFFCMNVYAITFDYVADWASEIDYEHLCTADFNRDGKTDIAIAGSNAIEIYSGTGQTPYFVKAATIELSGYFTFIISDDFNRDGKPDIAVSSYNFPEKFYVLLGDGNFSFQVSFEGALSYPRGLVSGDFNRDGKPDIAAISYNFYFNCYLGNGDGTFNLASSNATSYVSLYITAADFDNDGILDIAATGYYDSVVHIYRGKGDGTFHSPLNITVYSPWYIAKGDFNRDGKPDLAVASRSGPGMVAVLIGNGDCTFKTPVYYNTGGEPWAIEVSDFDGDGIEDMAVVNSYAQTLTVLKGKDNGAFQLDFTFVAQSLRAVVSGKFTEDGKKDLALLCNAAGIIFENSTDFGETGVFSNPVYYQTGQGPMNVIAADFNNDAILDLAVANYGSGDVSVLIGRSDGSFFPAVNYYFDSPFFFEFMPYGLVASDFNKDGNMDIAVSNGDGYAYAIMTNNGDATFEVNIFPTYYGSPFYSINSGDFNRDGNADIIISCASSSSGGLIVHFGKGDGTFDPLTFYSLSGALRTAIADFNKDGVSDIAVSSAHNNGVFLFTGNENGYFSNSGVISSGNNSVMPIFSDFNSDGNPDIAVTDLDNQDVSFWLGNGQNLFNLAYRYYFSDNSNPFGIVSGDFNRDGTQDLIVARIASTDLAFLAGNNDGSFTLGSQIPVELQYPVAVCAGDFDRNGTLDIAAVIRDANQLAIVYNLNIKKGDISADGIIDISDVILCLRMAINLPVEIRGTVYDSPYPQQLINRAKLADDGEPEVNISDVIKVLRKAIGLD